MSRNSRVINSDCTSDSFSLGSDGCAGTCFFIAFLDPLSTINYSKRLPQLSIGAGIEWAFADNWSAKLEYQYYDFGDNVETVKQQIHTVKIGLNYRFNLQ